MTDREKLIELIADKCDWKAKRCIGCEKGLPEAEDCKKDRFGGIADHLIANGVTFAKDTDVHSKWISVEDRLPNNEKPVLVYYGFMRNKNASTGLRYTGTLSYFCFDHKPHWQHESTGLVVTHWMPLPEPPKEE